MRKNGGLLVVYAKVGKGTYLHFSVILRPRVSIRTREPNPWPLALMKVKGSTIIPTEVILPRLRTIGLFRVPPGPLYQNEVKCSALDMEVIFYSHANKTHFQFTRQAVHLASLSKWGGPFRWESIFAIYCMKESSGLFAIDLKTLGTFLSRIYEAVARI